MKIQYRTAKENDYAAINNLQREDREQYAEEYPHGFKKPPALVMRKGDFLNSLEEEENDWQYLVAEAGGEVVGYIELKLDNYGGNRVQRARKVVEIEDLIIDKAFRRHGVGSALIMKAQDWAKERGAKEMLLNVYDFRSDAQKFYLEAGFKPISHNMLKRLPKP